MFGWFKRNKDIQENLSAEYRKVEIDFKKITDLVYIECGISDLDKRVLPFSRLKQYAEDKNITSTDQFLNLFKQQGEFYKDILSIVTVNETFFFREKKELDYLVEYIKNAPSGLKILSLPSSSGEEVYSILMLMMEENIPLDKVKIVGFDVDFEMIEKAKQGIYKQHSLHNVDDNLKSRYFDEIDENRWMVKPFFKNYVEFKQQNIFDITLTDEFDVILSRNMMIYFDEIKRKEAFEVISSLLKKDGLFIKGHADNINITSIFENIVFGIYKKIKI